MWRFTNQLSGDGNSTGELDFKFADDVEPKELPPEKKKDASQAENPLENEATVIGTSLPLVVSTTEHVVADSQVAEPLELSTQSSFGFSLETIVPLPAEMKLNKGLAVATSAPAFSMPPHDLEDMTSLEVESSLPLLELQKTPEQFKIEVHHTDNEVTQLIEDEPELEMGVSESTSISVARFDENMDLSLSAILSSGSGQLAVSVSNSLEKEQFVAEVMALAGNGIEVASSVEHPASTHPSGSVASKSNLETQTGSVALEGNWGQTLGVSGTHEINRPQPGVTHHDPLVSSDDPTIAIGIHRKGAGDKIAPFEENQSAMSAGGNSNEESNSKKEKKRKLDPHSSRKTTRKAGAKGANKADVASQAKIFDHLNGTGNANKARYPELALRSGLALAGVVAVAGLGWFALGEDLQKTLAQSLGLHPASLEDGSKVTNPAALKPPSGQKTVAQSRAAQKGLKNPRADGKKTKAATARTGKGANLKMAAKPLTQVSRGQATGSIQLAAEAQIGKRRVELQSESFEKFGPNARFYESLYESLQRGEPLLAYKRFKSDPPSPQKGPEEKEFTQEISGRFYMLFSSLPQANGLFVNLCKVVDSSHKGQCLHAARSAISMSDFKRSKSILGRIDVNADEWNNDIAVVNLLSAAHGALSQPTFRSMRPLTDHVLNEASLSNEWRRQRSIWFARAMMMMPRSERHKLAEEILVTKRRTLLDSLSAQELAMSSASDPILVPFLNYLAAESEFPLISTQATRMRADFDIGATAVFLYAMSKPSLESGVSATSLFASLSSKSHLKEIGKLISINASLQENDFAQAGHLVAGKFTASNQFGFEWAMVSARLALASQSRELWMDALSGLKAIETSEPRVHSDFFFWIVKAKLSRMLRQPGTSQALNQARALAISPRERGLVELEAARDLMEQGKKVEAFGKVKAALSAYPYHGPLLQAAAEFAGKNGVDPSSYITQQAAIPEGYERRSQEMPLLSEYSLSKILSSL